jgi:hypothetical protein
LIVAIANEERTFEDDEGGRYLYRSETKENQGEIVDSDENCSW